MENLEQHGPYFTAYIMRKILNNFYLLFNNEKKPQRSLRQRIKEQR